jgi:hypothetical protein
VIEAAHLNRCWDFLSVAISHTCRSLSGVSAKVDWDASDLAGRSPILMVEDRSPTAGLVVHEIAAY